MKRILSKIALVFVLLMVLGIGLLVILGSQRDTEPSADYAAYVEEHQALYDAEENGFHVLERAIAQVQRPALSLGQEFGELRFESDASVEAHEYVASYEGVLAKIQEGMDAEYLIAPPFRAGQIPRWQSDLRGATRLLLYDGQFKGRDGDISGMLDQYFNVLRLADSAADRGLLIHAMTSNSIEHDALEWIWPTLDQLDGSNSSILNEDELSRIIVELERYNAERADIDEIIENERIYSEEQMKLIPQSTTSRIFSPITRVVLNRITEPAIRSSRIQWNKTGTKLLGITLRARVLRYELKHGKPPSSLQLVMDGKPVPIDPITRNPFEIRNNVIFSPGPRPTEKDAAKTNSANWRSTF